MYQIKISDLLAIRQRIEEKLSFIEFYDFEEPYISDSMDAKFDGLALIYKNNDKLLYMIFDGLNTETLYKNLVISDKV